MDSRKDRRAGERRAGERTKQRIAARIRRHEGQEKPDSGKEEIRGGQIAYFNTESPILTLMGIGDLGKNSTKSGKFLLQVEQVVIRILILRVICGG